MITNNIEKYQIKNYNNDLKVNNTIEKLEDLLKLVPSGQTWYIPDFNISQTVTDYGFPEDARQWGTMTITNSIGNGHYLIELQSNSNYQFEKRWIGETKNGVAGANQSYQVKWQKLCTTSVADTNKTNVVFSDENNYSVSTSGRNYYIVKNGICYLSLEIAAVNVVGSWITVTPNSLPIPVGNTMITINAYEQTSYVDPLDLDIRTDGTIKLKGGINGGRYIDYISYPVAES